VDYLLAQVNIGRLLAPLDSGQVADFVAALEPVNAVADAAPGFVWRLQTEDGNATAVQAFEWDRAGAFRLAWTALPGSPAFGPPSQLVRRVLRKDNVQAHRRESEHG
jgi:hypothetical protein